MTRLDRFTGAIKYIISVVVMIDGLATVFEPIAPIDGAIGLLLNTRIALVFMGLVVFVSGLVLFVGKIRKKRRQVGLGLMLVYLCFVFGAVLNFWAYGSTPANWIGNAIMALVTAILWLKWKFKTEYIDPDQFRDELVEIRRTM